MLFRPAESSSKIVDYFRKYLLTTLKTEKDYYNQQLEEQLSQDGIVFNGPFISLTDPYVKGQSLRQLVHEGDLCEGILSLEKLYPDRKLYAHQVEAVKKYNEHKNLVVTTGTGSGKTECFLIPILNDLFKSKAEGTLTPGIRALIIYPMNALVNDQIRRLRELLGDTPDISFGKYTGETRERQHDAASQYKSLEKRNPPVNELISREQMRKTPPHIMITNYAMLEYLLLRPGDNIFFSSQYSTHWQTIVLDEAHTYSGAKGIEVGTLLRRVKATLRRPDVRFILTSATLGDTTANPQIIQFANALCDADYDDRSIIRSHAAVPQQPESAVELDFSIYNRLAELIRNNVEPHEYRLCFQSFGISYQEKTNAEIEIAENLHTLIRNDHFYYKVRKRLIHQTKPLGQLARELAIHEDDLTDFIAVASNAMLEGDRLFEARYHMFLRGIEGVFVTLHPSNKLFIRKMETYAEKPFEDSPTYQVYEIRFCHNCSATFLVGQTSNEGIFEQKSKYNDAYEPEVYMISGTLDTETLQEDDAQMDIQEHLLCSVCGAIARATSLDGLSCGHDKVNYNKVLKVKDRGDVLHTCSSCHAINTQRSIMRPFFIGNEAATAVIATALFNELPDTKVTRNTIEMEDKFFGQSSRTVIEEKEDLVRQFLTFSDNRQGAAFFASYLETTYHDNLIKRLMTLLSEEHQKALVQGIPLVSFARYLEALLHEHNIFQPEERNKEAWIAVAKEVINFKARNSLQNMGILRFDSDIDMPANAKLELSAEETSNLFKTMAQYLIKVGAIHWPVTLTLEDQKRLTSFGVVKGFDLNVSSKKYIDFWLPGEGKENTRFKYLRKLFPNMEYATIIDLLKSIWSTLINRQVISFYDKQYLLASDKILVKTVDKLYICDECRTITPYAVKRICANPRCGGKLCDYPFKERSDNAHYQDVYRNLTIHGLVAKEHTAQLGSEKAYDYQNKFKNKQINVLSCSTTFELGVDVGSLETVFMRNMPPSPANYVQRAGRAGRSLKSASYSLTYCPNSSHDLNYFNRPVAMIEGTIKPPAFNMDNEKIALRHIFASAFSHYWLSNSQMYTRTIGDFIDQGGFDGFNEYLSDKPANLHEYLKRILSKELYDFYQVASFGWIPLLFSNDTKEPGVFNIAIAKYQGELSDLEKSRKNTLKKLRSLPSGAKESGKFNWEMGAIDRSIKTLKGQRLIEFLSRNNLIPKYGFPVDTVELTSAGRGGSLGTLELDRDLYTAISEYAPESEVVADGMLITSRYVRVLSGFAWPEYNYSFCSHCQTLNKTIYTEKLPKRCRQCNHELPRQSGKYIIPKFGFIMDVKEPSRVGTNKPERTYKGALSYIGNGRKIENRYYEICDKQLIMGTSHMDELAILNTSDFYICKTCGYGKIHKNSFDRVVELEHKNPNGYYCSSKRLMPYALGHEFQTDVVLLKFTDENVDNIDAAWTILYALLEGLSKHIVIERNELSGCLQWYKNTRMNNEGNYGFVLFDNTPGGAGYVRQLKDPNTFIGMLREAEHIVSHCSCGGAAADTACYSCLCNYYNQKQHDLMKRSYAILFFSSMRNGTEAWAIKEVAAPEEAEDEHGDRTIAVFNNDGQNQSTMSYQMIWDYIAQDTDDLQEREWFETLKACMQSGNYEKPFYSGSLRLIETNEVIAADLIWSESKVLFFLKENCEDYLLAKRTDWEAYCIQEVFEAADFIKRLEN